MASRLGGGAPTGAPDLGGSPALLTLRRNRGSALPPRLPGGKVLHKASKRRRPDSRTRRHARRVQQADDAAAAAAPYATLFNSLAAWAAMGAAYWVLRTIRFGFQVPWERTPPPTRSAGYPLPAVKEL